MIVFVSYNNRNRARVEELVLQLGQLGHDVQFESKLIGGEVTWQQVLESIQASDLFVATMSAASLISYASRIEYDYARELNKYILLVAVEDIDTLTSLEPDVQASLIDFSPSNPMAHETLTAALSSLPNLEPRPVPNVPLPNWNVFLDELNQRIKAPNLDAVEQGAILLNLREFLERHDTFAKTKDLFARFAARDDLRPEIRAQTNRAASQVRHVGSLLQKVQRRGVFLIAIILSVIISLVVIVLSQVVSQIRAQRSVTLVLTATAATPRSISITATPVSTLIGPTGTLILESTAVPPTPVAPTLAASSTSTPGMTNSPIPNVIASETSRPSASPSPTSTVVQLTTNTPRATVTEQPVTATPALTSTPLPTATSVSPTQTQAAVAPIALPTQVVSLLPFNSPFTQLLNRNVYVGLGVEDSLFGVRVNVVGSSAKSAGVEVGDYILSVGLNMIRNRFEFARAMQTQMPSSEISLRMRRDSQVVTATWVLNDHDFVLLYPD